MYSLATQGEEESIRAFVAFVLCPTLDGFYLQWFDHSAASCISLGADKASLHFGQSIYIIQTDRLFQDRNQGIGTLTCNKVRCMIVCMNGGEICKDLSSNP